MTDIPQGIIDSLTHPQFTDLEFHADLGNPYSGDTWIEVPQTAALVPQYFGVVIEVLEIPPGYGFDIGFNGGPLDLSFDYYIDWFWQAVGVQQSRDGSEFGSVINYGHYARELITFDTSYQKALAIHCKPGIEVALFWLALI